jgi:hypothetical protein
MGYITCVVLAMSQFPTEINEEISTILEDCVTKIVNLLSWQQLLISISFKFSGSLSWYEDIATAISPYPRVIINIS